MPFFRFFYCVLRNWGFFYCVLRNWVLIFFKYSNSILVLKIKKRSFFWCNFYKKIMSYERVINV
ncbi:hypothetical protein HanRHA438_Chr12g0540361 [Helianthus annuus]|nr:hypothetical protein HanRHA438_Chr12g0540361 [Helianthus annuus]